MKKHKLTCPECGEEFHFRFIKNGYSGKITCAKCKEQLHVENKVIPYIVIAGMMFLCSDYAFAFVLQFHLPLWLTYMIVIAILLLICIVVILILRLVFGDAFLFSVHSRKEFDMEKERIDKMKQELKKKKSQEKK